LSEADLIEPRPEFTSQIERILCPTRNEIKIPAFSKTACRIIVATIPSQSAATELSDVEPLFVCKACSKRGADVRPDFHWAGSRSAGWVEMPFTAAHEHNT
jgi:hypothetical protein